MLLLVYVIGVIVVRLSVGWFDLGLLCELMSFCFAWIVIYLLIGCLFRVVWIC